ncbi:hypothetical protein JCM13664_20620 [Methylothermus subterraneus]
MHSATGDSSAGRRIVGRTRYPKLRKKGKHDRFTLTNEQFRVEGSRIRIPKLGWVRMREP